MTIEQLLVRLDRQRLRYAFVLADLRAEGESICGATAEQILLAELAGYVVNLRTGQVTHIPGYYPPWLDELLHEQSDMASREARKANHGSVRRERGEMAI